MLTKFLSLVLISLSLLTGAPSVSAQSNDEAAVTQALESLRKAMVAKDRGQFEALLSEHVGEGAPVTSGRAPRTGRGSTACCPS